MENRIVVTKVPLWRQALSWILPIVIGCTVALTARQYVFALPRVPTGSMYPTIPYPSRIFLDKVATELHKPYRGEVVCFYYPDDPTQVFVKRVIGMPGDTVSIHDGHVYINNHLLQEPYLKTSTSGDYGPYHVPPKSYFMLGDNRDNSKDSRFWQHTYVPIGYIIGRADFVMWNGLNVKRID